MKAPSQCPACGADTVRNEQHDAYFCKTCNAWTEARCTDPACEFCASRPMTPLEALGRTDENPP